MRGNTSGGVHIDLSCNPGSADPARRFGLSGFLVEVTHARLIGQSPDLPPFRPYVFGQSDPSLRPRITDSP